MKFLKSSLLHFSIVMGSCSLSCLILVLSRNYVDFKFPLFEEIIAVSTLAALSTFGLSLYLKKVSFINDSIRLICYVNFIALLISVLVLPYSLLNVDRSRSFYVLSWVDQGRILNENSRTVVKVYSTEAADIAGVELRLK